MDYDELAKEFLSSMRSIQGAKYHKFVQESCQGEASVLYYIKEVQGEIMPGRISEEIGVSSARVAVILSSLESKGLITREIDSEDRRKIIVRLTQKGRNYVEEQRGKHIELAKDILIRLGDGDAKELVRIIRRLEEIFISPHSK